MFMVLSSCCSMLGNKDLQWVTSFKYLGINFLSGLVLKIDTCQTGFFIKHVMEFLVIVVQLMSLLN